MDFTCPNDSNLNNPLNPIKYSHLKTKRSEATIVVCLMSSRTATATASLAAVAVAAATAATAAPAAAAAAAAAAVYCGHTPQRHSKSIRIILAGSGFLHNTNPNLLFYAGSLYRSKIWLHTEDF